MIAYPGRTFGQLYHRFVRSNALSTGRFELGDRTIDLSAITVPVLVFAGATDGIAPVAAVKAVVPAAHRRAARCGSRSCPAATSACSPAGPRAARPGGCSTSGSASGRPPTRPRRPRRAAGRRQEDRSQEGRRQEGRRQEDRGRRRPPTKKPRRRRRRPRRRRSRRPPTRIGVNPTRRYGSAGSREPGPLSLPAGVPPSCVRGPRLEPAAVGPDRLRLRVGGHRRVRHRARADAAALPHRQPRHRRGGGGLHRVRCRRRGTWS